MSSGKRIASARIGRLHEVTDTTNHRDLKVEKAGSIGNELGRKRTLSRLFGHISRLKVETWWNTGTFTTPRFPRFRFLPFNSALSIIKLIRVLNSIRKHSGEMELQLTANSDNLES